MNKKIKIANASHNRRYRESQSLFVVRLSGLSSDKKILAYQCYFGMRIADPYRPLEDADSRPRLLHTKFVSRLGRPRRRRQDRRISNRVRLLAVCRKRALACRRILLPIARLQSWPGSSL